MSSTNSYSRASATTSTGPAVHIDYTEGRKFRNEKARAMHQYYTECYHRKMSELAKVKAAQAKGSANPMSMPPSTGRIYDRNVEHHIIIRVGKAKVEEPVRMDNGIPQVCRHTTLIPLKQAQETKRIKYFGFSGLMA